MPRGDGTGPVGTGPMTGRSVGYCAGYSVPGYGNPILGRGFGRGFARGRGLGAGRGFGAGRGLGAGRGFGGPQMAWPGGVAGQMPYGQGNFAAQTQEEEKGLLQGQADLLQNQLNDIRKRLDELSSQETPKT
ncbi:DUF5320 domain-containing protein [Desulfonema magnum]|nr:DUF5320 domain-containing protein [Desulfonema magnum]